jgi:hypothetical protein
VLEQHFIATAMTCCSHMHTYPRRGLYSTDDFQTPPPPDKPGNANLVGFSRNLLASEPGSVEKFAHPCCSI